MLQTFLNNKPLYYEEIDYTRMPRVYARIKTVFKNSSIIHIVGTNGKGTTGRFLACALYAQGYSVGHYTSPHIANFNERIWLNGNLVSNDELHIGHEKLLKVLTTEEADSLSYFEYTTFLAMLIYNSTDYIILEAGLGGEYDATAVFENTFTLVTPIAQDHEAFLGNTIEKIATTKLNAVQKFAILAEQVNTEVYSVADVHNIKYQKVQNLLNKEDERKIVLIKNNLSLASYLESNLKLAICALKQMKIDYNVEDFNNSKLFGRLSFINENIIVDVGHNVLAAKAILNSLNGGKYTLVYNSYKDKNYQEIIKTLKPIIESIEIIKIDDERIEISEKLKQVLQKMDFNFNDFKEIQKNKKYLVFGSFRVVEEFLKAYNE